MDPIPHTMNSTIEQDQVITNIAHAISTELSKYGSAMHDVLQRSFRQLDSNPDQALVDSSSDSNLTHKLGTQELDNLNQLIKGFLKGALGELSNVQYN